MARVRSDRIRLAALGAAVLAGVLVPLAGASAGSLGDLAGDVVRQDAAGGANAPRPQGGGQPAASDEPSAPADDEADDAKGEGAAGPAAPREGDKRPDADEDEDKGKGKDEARSGAKGESGLLSGLGLTAAAHCGPELASPEGVEAQTCVLTQRDDTWARTYYRNATGQELRSVLTLMGPGGRTVQMHCAVGTGDEPRACETPREPSRGGPQEYTAVAEFAARERSEQGAGKRPLLLRSGSNEALPKGS